MTKSARHLHVLLFTGFCAAQTMLFGQSYFGTVSGEITDPSQAAVPGAQVTLADQQKGYQFTRTTDGSGRYLFTSVPPGRYSVSTDVAGFEKSVRTNIAVDVNQNVTANLSLKVATARQTVDVQSQTQSLATEDAETGQVVNRRLINDLPLVGDPNFGVINYTAVGPRQCQLAMKLYF